MNKIIFADSGTGKTFFRSYYSKSMNKKFYEPDWKNMWKIKDVKAEQEAFSYYESKRKEFESMIEKGYQILSALPLYFLYHVIQIPDIEFYYYYPAATEVQQKEYSRRMRERGDIEGYKIRKKYFIEMQEQRVPTINKFKNLNLNDMHFIEIYNPNLYLLDFYDEKADTWLTYPKDNKTNDPNIDYLKMYDPYRNIKVIGS